MLFKVYALYTENFQRYLQNKHKQNCSLNFHHLEILQLTPLEGEVASSKLKAGESNGQYQGLSKSGGKAVQICLRKKKNMFQTNFNLFMRGSLHLFSLKGNFLIERDHSLFTVIQVSYTQVPCDYSHDQLTQRGKKLF